MSAVARALAFLAAAALGVAACAIPEDPEPRAIDAADVPYDLLSPSTAPPPTLGANIPAEDTVIYLAMEREGKVTPAIRRVPRPVSLDQRLLQLFEARPDPQEYEDGKSNVITSHTRIREVRQETVDHRRRVIIDLERFFPGLGSDDVSLAVAQVVFTVDAHYPGAEVEFRVDGQPESIPTGDGTALDFVTRQEFCDFDQEVDPDCQSARAASTTTTAVPDGAVGD